jgi:SAM-dependent methyltransferase
MESISGRRESACSTVLVRRARLTALNDDFASEAVACGSRAVGVSRPYRLRALGCQASRVAVGAPCAVPTFSEVLTRSSSAVTNSDPILAEQVAYYRARAREYDRWFRREGLHDLGEERNARWRLELNRVFSALDAFAPRGDVLELAYGTGEWTIRLAESATNVVGVDAAPEMRELALAKLQDAGRSNVELRVDDLFSWQPDQDYDVVFFAFWLSHVPESHAYRFWRSVRDALRPGGRFFLVDAARAVVERNVIHGSRLPDRENAAELRRLEDGREFRIIKRSLDPDRLARDLREHGLDASFVETGEFFVYGLGRRA